MTANYQIEKTLPASEDAERVILGAVLLDNGLMRQTKKLTVADFYHSDYRAAFSAMLELEEENRPIDPILIGEILKRENYHNLSTPEITNFTLALPKFSTIAPYVAEVAEKSARRQAALRLERLQQSLINEKISLSDFCKSLHELEHDLRESRAEETGSFKTLAEVLETEVLPTLEAYHKKEVSEFLIPTGFYEIDQILSGGLYLSDMLAIVAPPKSAKSAFALQLGLNIASAGETVGLLSLEMSNLQNGLRFIAQKSFADSIEKNGNSDDAIAANWLAPGIYKSTYEQASRVAASLFETRLLMCQKPLDWAEFQIEVRRLVAEKNLRVIIVDYWQLVRNSRRGLSRADSLAEIAKGLKQLGQELNICVIALGQFNQEGLKDRAKGNDLNAQLYLEGSGELVKSANIVLTIDIKEADLNDTVQSASRYGTLTFRPLRSGADKRLDCLFYGKYLTVVIK